jgi:hypothetical protein
MRVRRNLQSPRKNMKNRTIRLEPTRPTIVVKRNRSVQVFSAATASYELSEIGYGLASTKNVTKKALEKKYASINVSGQNPNW